MTIRNPYDGGANTRINEVTLQYRIGTSGTWTSLTGIEYQNNTTLQTTAVTTPQNLQSKSITLPVGFVTTRRWFNLRWPSRQVSGGGSRPSFAIDNVSVTGSALCPYDHPIEVVDQFWKRIGRTIPADSVYTVSGQYPDERYHRFNRWRLHRIADQRFRLYTTLTLTQSGGSVASTSVYVRFRLLQPDLPAGRLTYHIGVITRPPLKRVPARAVRLPPFLLPVP